MTTRIKRVITTITNAGQAIAEVHSEQQVNGQWWPMDPVPLATAGPEWDAWKTAFGAAVVAERDQLATDKAALATQLASITTERDSLQADAAAKAQRIVELEAQLEALLHPVANPRHVAPFDFLARFTFEERIALLTSSDPVLVDARAQLQTIITYVDLDLPMTQQLVGYMEQAGLIAPGRAAEILA